MQPRSFFGLPSAGDADPEGPRRETHCFIRDDAQRVMDALVEMRSPASDGGRRLILDGSFRRPASDKDGWSCLST